MVDRQRVLGVAAFNVASIVFGAAAAPLGTSAVPSQFGGNYRVAFALVMPITFVGAAFLLAARRHIENDTAKIFEAVVAAVAARMPVSGSMPPGHPPPS